MSGSEAFIASGSENGEILFWDVKSKELVQRVDGHEGVVIWVDTCPGQSGTLVSGGLDGTVRIWTDANEERDAHVNGLTSDHESSVTPPGQLYDGSDVAQIKLENGRYDGDTGGERMSVDGDGTPAQDGEELAAALALDEIGELKSKPKPNMYLIQSSGKV